MEYLVVAIVSSLMCFYLCLRAHPVINNRVFTRTWVDRSQRPYRVISLTADYVTIEPTDGGPIVSYSYNEFMDKFRGL